MDSTQTPNPPTTHGAAQRPEALTRAMHLVPLITVGLVLSGMFLTCLSVLAHALGGHLGDYLMAFLLMGSLSILTIHTILGWIRASQ